MHGSTSPRRRVARLVAVMAALIVATTVMTMPAGASTSALTPAQTSITLATRRPIAHYGDAGNITATVKAAARAAGVPTGSVDFSVDGAWYISEPVNAAGKAILPLADLYPSLYPGTYAVTATYSGDVNHDPSTTAAPLAQTIVGISEAPVTTLALNGKGLPAFTPRSFTLSSVSPVGCNVTITNSTPTAQALVYGTPGAWKRLPGGTIAAGASRGIGVGIGNYTGYFSTMANTNNYVAIHCR